MVDVAVFVVDVLVVVTAAAGFVPPRSWFPILIVNYWFYILGIKDPEEKKKAMMELFESLPTPNRHTSIYLLDHLRRYVTCSVALVKCRPWRGDTG